MAGHGPPATNTTATPPVVSCLSVLAATTAEAQQQATANVPASTYTTTTEGPTPVSQCPDCGGDGHTEPDPELQHQVEAAERAVALLTLLRFFRI